MLDKKSIELINAGVDGELTVEGIQELDTLLESSPEAGELHSELLRLSNFLDALPDQRPPPELSRQLLKSIKLPGKPALFSLRNLFSSIQPLATATAFAAGLLLTIGFYEMTPQLGSNDDLAKMVGTAVLSNGKNSQGQGVHSKGQLVLKESWITGTVSLDQSRNLFVLNFELDSSDTVGVELELDDADLEFAGIAQEASQPGSINDVFSVSGGALHVENQGRQSFVVFLRKAASKDSGKEINIEFSSGDKRVVKGFSG